MTIRPAINLVAATFLGFAFACNALAQEAGEKAAPPKVGETAKEFKLPGLGEDPVDLAELADKRQVVVVVLRGWPGYQCPICARQMASFVRHAKEFSELKASVVFIYPGPEAELAKRAEEFLRGEKLPAPFVMAIDPGYKFTNIYGLRWDEPQETALPSTFVLDPERKVKFQKISHSHGDRADVEDVLAALRGE